jgi:4-amino-4-deoxy-L-arabinose transferase-like glycosyltransferase
VAFPDDRAVSSASLKLPRPRALGAAWEHAAWHVVAAGVAIAAYLAFSLAYLLDYPPVYSDEPWLLSAPIHIVRTGHDALPMFGEHYSAALYYDYYLAGFLELFGIGIGTGRLVSVLHGLGVLVLVFLLARRLAPRVAWVAPVVLVATFPFVEVSHYVRPDIVATFYGVLALWLYLLGRDGRRWYLAAAGASAGFAAALFYEGVWAIAVLGIWALADIRRARGKLAWLIGGAVAALVPLLVFVLGDLHDYRRFTTKFGGSSIFGGPQNHEPLPVAIWHSLLREPDRYTGVELWSHSKVYVAALVALAVLGLAGAAVRSPVRLAALLLVPLAVLAFAGANKTTIYFVIAAPAVAVLVAAFAARSRASLALVLMLAVVLVAGYGANLGHELNPVRSDYRSVERAYQRAFAFPPRSLVVGIPLIYAYYLNNSNVEFRSIHIFTSFDDFRIESPRQIAARFDALSRSKRIYLVYDRQTFDAAMEQIDPDPVRLRSLDRLVQQRFRAVAMVPVRGSASGDFDTTIAVYEPAAGRRR